MSLNQQFKKPDRVKNLSNVLEKLSIRKNSTHKTAVMKLKQVKNVIWEGACFDEFFPKIFVLLCNLSWIMKLRMELDNLKGDVRKSYDDRTTATCHFNGKNLAKHRTIHFLLWSTVALGWVPVFKLSFVSNLKNFVKSTI